MVHCTHDFLLKEKKNKLKFCFHFFSRTNQLQQFNQSLFLVNASIKSCLVNKYDDLFMNEQDKCVLKC